MQELGICIYCECSTNKYCYEPAGHVVTGDLNIIRDASLRSLIEKGLSYREQNCINWIINEKICKDAVAKRKRKWSLRERVDVQAFNEWENMVNYCIRRRITFLRGKYINIYKETTWPQIQEAFKLFTRASK